MGGLIGNLGDKNITSPDPSIAAPWDTMDSSEKGARLLGGAIKGAGRGIQSYQQQNAMMRQPQGGGAMPQMGGAQPVDSSYFAPSPNPLVQPLSSFQQPPRRGPNMMNFYGGQ